MTRGAVLIVTSWILAILTLFAIGIGFRTGLDIKLTGYSLDRVKALYIAKAGIKRAVIEKWEEYAEGKSLGLDAFSELWANNDECFKEIKVGDGTFTLSYSPGELDRSGKEITLYGLEDETRKININIDSNMPVLKYLLMSFDLGLEEAEAIVSAIVDWRDVDNIPKVVSAAAGGAEDIYYQALETPYATSGEKFKTIEELLLVKGITKGLYDKIADYITIFGEGGININTAREEALNAVFGIGYPELAAKIVDYRRGVDGKIGTDDDRHFTKGAFIIERGSRGLVEVKDLNDENWYGNIFGIRAVEYERIKELTQQEGLLSTASDYYRANVTACVDRVKKEITTVIKFDKPPEIREEGFSEEIPPPEIEYLYWREER